MAAGSGTGSRRTRPMLSLIWPLVVAAGIAGWGAAAVGIVGRRTSIDRTHPAEVLLAGIAVVVALTGLLAAAGLGQLALPTVLAGVVAGGLPARTWYLAHREEAGTTRFLLVGTAAVLVLLIVTSSYVGHLSFHEWDDPNYLYLADRFRLQGNLTDPGNLRRIQSMGSLTALQSVFLAVQPAVLLRMADLWLGGLLVVLVGGWRGPRRWSGPGLAVGGAVCVLYPLLPGMNFNTSPVLLPVGGFAVLLGQAVRVRTWPVEAGARAAAGVALGASGMALCTMRAYVAFPVMAVVAAAAVGARRPDGRRAAGVVAALWTLLGAVVVGAGWALAGVRDAATPMYPLLPGNTDTTFPQSGVQVLPVTLGEWLPRVLGGALIPPWLPLAAVGTWGVARYARRTGTASPTASSTASGNAGEADGWLGSVGAVRSASIVTFASAGAVLAAWLAVFTLLFWNFGPPYLFLLTRYYQPLLVGLTLAVIAVLVRLGCFEGRASQFSRVLALTMAIAMAVFAVDARDRVVFLGEDLATARLVRTDLPDPFARFRSDYDAVRAQLPPGASVFSATDLPDLMLDPRYSLETLDLVGFASRTPHLPFFTGDQAKLDWLRARGFDHLVAMKPGSSWSLYQASKFAEAPPNPDFAGWDPPWATYRDDWSDFVERLPALLPGKVSEHGRLLVVDLRPGAVEPEGAADTGR